MTFSAKTSSNEHVQPTAWNHQCTRSHYCSKSLYSQSCASRTTVNTPCRLRQFSLEQSFSHGLRKESKLDTTSVATKHDQTYTTTHTFDAHSCFLTGLATVAKAPGTILIARFPNFCLDSELKRRRASTHTLYTERFTRGTCSSTTFICSDFHVQALLASLYS